MLIIGDSDSVKSDFCHSGLDPESMDPGSGAKMTECFVFLIAVVSFGLQVVGETVYIA